MAMSYLQLGQRPEAQAELSQCRETIENNARGRLGVGDYQTNGHWHDRLINHILLREAVMNLPGNQSAVPNVITVK